MPVKPQIIGEKSLNLEAEIVSFGKPYQEHQPDHSF